MAADHTADVAKLVGLRSTRRIAHELNLTVGQVAGVIYRLRNPPRNERTRTLYGCVASAAIDPSMDAQLRELEREFLCNRSEAIRMVLEWGLEYFWMSESKGKAAA